LSSAQPIDFEKEIYLLQFFDMAEVPERLLAIF